MSNAPILEALGRFTEWKQTLIGHVRELSSMAADLGFSSSGSMLKLESLAHHAEQDAASVAFVGEFSRGKSELINALFFSDTGKRLMPSSTGQTTMCPVEIRGASGQEASLSLLPIQSRGMDASIKALKNTRTAWHNYTIDRNNEKEIAATLNRLTETVCVDIADARKIGLCPPLNKTDKGMERTVCPSCGLGKVLIPKWRHAILSFPHPLLNAGLTILDTPGLNSMGAEPELTLSMLSGMDAIVFILAADTGVTQSDHTIWNQYIVQNQNQTHIVLLNKIDTLWDELRSLEDIDKEVQSQVAKTAERLDLSQDQVIPVSGQKGLVARIKNDHLLLERSGITVLEDALADVVIQSRYNHIRHQFEKSVMDILQDQKQGIQDRLKQTYGQIETLESLKNRSAGKVEVMVAKHEETLRNFDNDKKLFEQRKEIFQQAVQDNLIVPLSTDDFDIIIRSARDEMLSAWTTAGIVARFKQFFQEAIAHFDRAMSGAQKVSDIVSAEYKILQSRYLLPDMRAIPYAMMPRRSELLEMAERYERFGMQMEIAVNTQNSVVKKVFLTVAAQTRDFVVETRKESEQWVDEVMYAMQKQMENFRTQSEEQIQALQQIAQTVGSMDARLNELRDKVATTREIESRVAVCAEPLLRMLEDG